MPKLFQTSRIRHLIVILTCDVLLIFLSLFLAHQIRFEFQLTPDIYRTFFDFFLYAVVIKISVFYFFDLYKGMWRYTSLNSLLNVFKASFVSSLTLVTFILWKYRFHGISRSVFLIDLCLTLIFISGIRVASRLFYERTHSTGSLKAIFPLLIKKILEEKKTLKRILIIGAGDCGEKILREINDNASINMNVMGFLDDDSGKIGRKIHGVTVLGHIGELKEIVRAFRISEVIIAIPSAGASRMREIVELCKTCDIDFKTVPGIGELINGRVSINEIRQVEYRDLLGREPVHLDTDRIGGYLEGKTVFVSGAGGSIGSGLCRQICRFLPRRIVLFERAESPLYEIDLELRKNFPHTGVVPILGDIQSESDLDAAFSSVRPDIVFHAAAYKHVPMMEQHPWKAVENNITGTDNLVRISDRFTVEKFVFISTDKAVNPTNIMGASKRISEMIVQNRSLARHSKTCYVTVRFGNVIGSVGSVIPLFKKQISEGGPVTVTHPDMIRYFMLIPEACQLILQAGAMGKGGEIFILEMGNPVKIDSMARDLIRFSGFEPDVDIKIEYIGLRPGEKLYEELMTDQEGVVPTDHQKILVVNSCEVDMDVLNGNIRALRQAAAIRDNAKTKTLFKEMVPEYHPL